MGVGRGGRVLYKELGKVERGEWGGRLDAARGGKERKGKRGGY